MSRLLLIRRAQRFSTVDTNVDAAVLDRIAHSSQCPFPCDILDEDDVVDNRLPYPSSAISHVLNMARGSQCLNILGQWEARGITIINAPKAVRSCQRGILNAILLEEGLITYSHTDQNGYWVKPADSQGLHAGGSIYCNTMAEAEVKRQQYINNGFDDTIISAHVEGRVVKFYGVTDAIHITDITADTCNAVFFRTYDAEKRPMHLPTSIQQSLRHAAFRLARRLSIHVFGGDAIVQDNGDVAVIDLNDWPSFSPCVDEAATAIVTLLSQEV